MDILPPIASEYKFQGPLGALYADHSGRFWWGTSNTVAIFDNAKAIYSMVCTLSSQKY